MKKSNVRVLLAVFISIAFWGISILTLYSLFDTAESDGEYRGLRWIREESYFVDYSIVGDIVQFRYSICFNNTSGHDLLISPVSAEFDVRELNGWLEYEDFFRGKIDGAEYEALIPDGEKVHIIFVFEGTYLGGEVNQKLSNPVDLVFSQRFAPHDAVIPFPS